MGEFELLARIRERLPPVGPRMRLGSGDDAAVTVPGGATATSVDAIVDGVHFRRELAAPAQIGHKALATALSDLAAMGAEPGEAYVVLGAPPDLGEADCLALLDGMAKLAERTGTTLAGGDLTRAAKLFLAVTVVGHAPRAEDFVTRGGAQPGDALVLTGELGGAAAGLALLTNQPQDGDFAFFGHIGGENTKSALEGRQLEPEPRLAAGRALARAGATAMIDLSDGLGGDGVHVAEASGVALRIEAGALPRAAGVEELAAALGHEGAWRLLLGGEDYELLAALPRQRLEEARQAVEATGEAGLTEIGEVRGGAGVEIRLPGGGTLEPAGFDQLASGSHR
jgi:thiamine-monophosphate kinase